MMKFAAFRNDASQPLLEDRTEAVNIMDLPNLSNFSQAEMNLLAHNIPSSEDRDITSRFDEFNML